MRLRILLLALICTLSTAPRLFPNTIEEYEFEGVTLSEGGTITGTFDFTPGIGFSNLDIFISADGGIPATNDVGPITQQDPSGFDLIDADFNIIFFPQLDDGRVPISTSPIGNGLTPAYKLNADTITSGSVIAIGAVGSVVPTPEPVGAAAFFG